MGIWSWNFWGEDKLQQNLSEDATATIVNTKPTKQEEETLGYTYDNISEEMRNKAISNESISMAANAYEKGVFGAGISIQNTSEDDTQNEEIEKLIKQFSKAKNFEIQERYHFNYWARFMSKDIIREPGILIRKHRATLEQASKRGWEIPYKIEMLEISRIDFSRNDKEKKIYNGVEVDRFNKPRRLHFKGGKSVSFKELIMYSSITRSTQYNGVSPIYPSLPSITRQEDHAKAEVKNAEETAKVNHVWTTKMADMQKVQAQGDFDADILSGTKKEQRKLDPRMPEGVAKIIDIDESYTALDRGSYTSAFDSLNKFANTRIAAGIGLTLDEYTQDLSDLTFHGGQVAQIKNDETYSIIRDNIIELVVNEFMEDMVKWCYITGYSNIDIEKLTLEYIKKPRKSAQPSKEAAAFEKNYQNSFMTAGDIVKQISGENYPDFLKRNEKEELLKIASQERILKAKESAGLLEENSEEEDKNV